VLTDAMAQSGDVAKIEAAVKGRGGAGMRKSG